LFNKSFVHLWIGAEHFAGTMENFFIILMAVQFIFFQSDSLIINVSLNLKMKVLLSIVASVFTLLFAYLLVEEYQILGLCWSIILGRLILTVGYPLILKKQMSDNSGIHPESFVRPLTVALI